MECYCYLRNVSYQVGKNFGAAILENCSKDQSFRFVQWSKMIRSLRKTSQDSINVVKKFYLEYSWDVHYVRGETVEIRYFGRRY